MQIDIVENTEVIYCFPLGFLMALIIIEVENRLRTPKSSTGSKNLIIFIKTIYIHFRKSYSNFFWVVILKLQFCLAYGRYRGIKFKSAVRLARAHTALINILIISKVISDDTIISGGVLENPVSGRQQNHYTHFWNGQISVIVILLVLWSPSRVSGLLHRPYLKLF